MNIKTGYSKKDTIADVFQKHFNHFGFKKTSVDDISKELRVSKKTIYQHFSSKEKVFYFIVNRFAVKMRKKMEKQLSPTPSEAQKIDRLVKMIFTQSRKWLKQNNTFEFKYKYEIASLAFKNAYRELLEKIVKDGNKNCEFKVDNIDLAISFIQGIITESLNIIQVSPKQKIEDQTISSILKLLT